MDPISIGVLTALAGGAGGEAGRQAWLVLSRLVRRPSPKDDPADDPVGDLVALESNPADVARAQVLSQSLQRRAELDPGFAGDLRVWSEQARALHLDKGSTHNTISGTVHGGAVQGRDFGSISFGSGRENG